MASGGYEVTFRDLDAAASAYLAAAEDLKTAMVIFQAQAQLSPGDFGRLPSSSQTDAGYQTFYEQIMEQMHTLHTQLCKGGGKIATSAAVYKAAEDAVAIAAQTI